MSHPVSNVPCGPTPGRPEPASIQVGDRPMYTSAKGLT
jgi:hypothetical protein